MNIQIYSKAYLEKKPEDIIICEKEEENYCGRNALRALSQRLDLFSDEYLIEVAENIAATEQIWLDGEPVPITDYHYLNNGDYDIQILKAAAQNMLNIEFIQIQNLEENNCPVRNLIVSNMQHSQAFFIEQNYHYYCLRRFRLTKDYFFTIDSKYPMHHQPIHPRDILKFLRTRLESHWNIYVIIQHIQDNFHQVLSIDNIESKLWALPDASADLERLPGFYDTE